MLIEKSPRARRYRAMLEHLPQTAIVVFDRDLRIELVTGPALAAAGLNHRELEGQRLESVVGPQVASTLMPHYRRALAGEEVSLHYRSALDERSYWLTIVPLRDELGEVEAGMAVTLDVTDRTTAQEALRRSEDRFRRAFDEAPIGMALVALDGQLRKVNAALCQITGRDAGDLVPRYLSSLVPTEDTAALVDALGRFAVTPGSPGGQESHRAELRLVHATGRVIPTALHVAVLRDAAGTAEHLLLQVQDITDRKHFEAQLRFMADHDPLTGLLNRRGFERELHSHLARVRRYGPHGALLAMDLDHFKLINDTLGHAAGDELVVRITRLLAKRLRESDVLARIGGDEFAVLLPYANPEQAATLAAGLLEIVRQEELRVGDGRLSQITTSIGVSMFDADLSAREMLIRADVAMYEAKETGRDRFSFYAEGDDVPGARARITWAERIRAALREDRLILHAQPIVPLDDSEPEIFELLLRMVEPDGEIVPPGAFLPVAERFDLIPEIDRWVIRRAIELLATTAAHGTMQVAVNVSGRSLGDATLLGEIEDLIAEHGVAPERLMFEVTETAVIANIQPARRFAERLRELGCRFALDDFGSGFGSFYYLKHLPFDLIKIDGEFVSSCLTSRTDRLLIEAVVTLARGLGKQTVAELTPDQSTLELLASLGVDYSQSFFTGPPLPLAETPLGVERDGPALTRDSDPTTHPDATVRPSSRPGQASPTTGDRP